MYNTTRNVGRHCLFSIFNYDCSACLTAALVIVAVTGILKVTFLLLLIKGVKGHVFITTAPKCLMLIVKIGTIPMEV